MANLKYLSERERFKNVLEIFRLKIGANDLIAYVTFMAMVYIGIRHLLVAKLIRAMYNEVSFLNFVDVDRVYFSSSDPVFMMFILSIGISLFVCTILSLVCASCRCDNFYYVLMNNRYKFIAFILVILLPWLSYFFVQCTFFRPIISDYLHVKSVKILNKFDLYYMWYTLFIVWMFFSLLVLSARARSVTKFTVLNALTMAILMIGIANEVCSDIAAKNMAGKIYMQIEGGGNVVDLRISNIEFVTDDEVVVRDGDGKLSIIYKSRIIKTTFE
ncbi:hypothetical protein PCS_02637 [Desulfocurvibacter africanus PCS]|uniref:Uncharacterized protein n=1 Tax=Desulfocurvibacter africanus PCS TaxID=1262666 RepID=M5PRD2_DESAF|nr:hypothetical protein [Desulfocurvibacter africanus]EMG36625.1 hypothetical protein PCS_02637 [Desulfocurvibacter africanus PCS]